VLLAGGKLHGRHPVAPRDPLRIRRRKKRAQELVALSANADPAVGPEDETLRIIPGPILHRQVDRIVLAQLRLCVDGRNTHESSSALSQLTWRSARQADHEAKRRPAHVSDSPPSVGASPVPSWSGASSAAWDSASAESPARWIMVMMYALTSPLACSTVFSMCSANCWSTKGSASSRSLRSRRRLPRIASLFFCESEAPSSPMISSIALST